MMKQYVITVKLGVDTEAFAQRLENEGIFIDHNYEALLRHFLVSMDENNHHDWLKDTEVAHVEPADKRISIASIEKKVSVDQHGHGGNWGLVRISKRNWNNQTWFPINDTWKSIRNGFGVDVYVVDSGCNTSHKDFGGRVSIIYDAYKPEHHPQYGMDVTGHGTNICSIIGGQKYGIAPGVFIYVAKVFNTDDGSLASILAGMNACLKHHLEKGDDRPSIINLSIGGRHTGPTEAHAVNDLIDAGMVCLASAGNDGKNLNGTDLELWPAEVENAITVAATGIKDDITWFSNYGRVVDLFAPGQYIVAAGCADDTCEIMLSGTSQACPMVAGVCALYLEGHKKLKTTAEVLQVQEWVKNNATPNVVALSPEAIEAGTCDRLLFAEFIDPN